MRLWSVTLLLVGVLTCGVSEAAVPAHSSDGVAINTAESVRLAVEDLCETFGQDYARGREYLARLYRVEKSGDRKSRLAELAAEALLDNPLLDFESLLVLKRKRGQLGLPVNHKCNTGIKQTGYDNEIAVFSPVDGGGKLRTLFRSEKGLFVGEIDLDFDADRLLFTMPNGRTWQIHEIGIDGGGLRQISREQSGVDNFDACYLPDGRIVFASTASYHAVPCWHGQERACAIYQMRGDGGGVRQLCFDQDLDLHPSVLDSGQVIYSRWDYSGPMHMYLRPLMVMNPDGTGQRAVYGSNSYWPNALYFPRGMPGESNKIIAIIAGYHGVPRMGELGLIDLTLGAHEADGIVQRIPGRGKAVEPVIRDNLVDGSWPKFLHPYPLSDKHFLVAAQPARNEGWGIYLVDVFDNMVEVCADAKHDFFEPIPVMCRERSAVIPDKVDLGRADAIVYVHDVYAGPGLAGVPRGTVEELRVIAYEFGYPGLAGPDKIGSGGPWEVMKILGTVPVADDGSAMFRVPANTPLAVQAVDASGSAVQLMRSWFTAMPGEIVSCVGCHEKANEAPPAYGGAAARHGPVDIRPWYGKPRGFDFEREVQPVLDRYCVGCHDGRANIADLRRMELVKDYEGRELSDLGRKRLHPDVRKVLAGTKVKYTPAYEALLPYVRRVGVEDDVHMPAPGEYHTDTSELIQMLKKGHRGVELDDEGWRRLYAWIDLNAPCHGSWSEVAPVPEGADKRRREIQRLYGNAVGVFEELTKAPPQSIDPVVPVMPVAVVADVAKKVDAQGWPFDAVEARRRQAALGKFEREVDLGGGVSIRLIGVPAGEFVMGDAMGSADERPLRRVRMDESFWISAFEITNEQYRCFDVSHRSGHFTKRYQGRDGPGLSLDGAKQPVVRVSWERAMEFCRWLSERTGMQSSLPTEEQWEYACRAGSLAAFSFGRLDSDFSRCANFADRSLSVRPGPTGGLGSNITEHKGNGIFLSAILGGNIVCDGRFDDGAIGTADVGEFQPNSWGLYDMHGNAAEWTASEYEPDWEGDKKRIVVRGGSFHDRPRRGRNSFRLGYQPWQRVFNVGFRVVCEGKGDLAARE